MTIGELTALVWTIISALGVLIGVVTAKEARKDLLALAHSRRDGPMLLVAESTERRQLVRLGTQAVFCVIGLLALKDPRMTAAHPGEDLVMKAFVSALIVLGLGAMVANTWLDFRASRHLLDILARHTASPPEAPLA